jgi:SHS2 domain-containing protein
LRYSLPQPYQDLSHTADLGVAVDGASAEEALSRLVLALGTVLAGSGAVETVREETLAVPVRGDLARNAVDLLRELLYRFATERIIPCACEVLRLDGEVIEARIGFGRWDPVRHADGADVKAVTYHAAQLEQVDGRWRGQVLFDV